MRKLIWFAAGAAVIASSPALAATNSTTMDVSATVVNNCVVAASPMAFGTLATLGTSNIDTSATVSLTCTPDAAYDVALGLGLNAGASAQRELVNGADSTQRIPYNLYKDASRTQAWGTGTGNTIAGTATGGIATLTAYGRIPSAATKVKAGAYSDTVTVTVTF